MLLDIKLLSYAIVRSCQPRPTRKQPLEKHLQATYAWICQAQDSTPDHGVAAGYNLLTGWSLSYPETTGYIIPSLLAYARVRNCHEARSRALRMADWETEVQMPCGAVQSGRIGRAPPPPCSIRDK